MAHFCAPPEKSLFPDLTYRSSGNVNAKNDTAVVLNVVREFHGGKSGNQDSGLQKERRRKNRATKISAEAEAMASSLSSANAATTRTKT